MAVSLRLWEVYVQMLGKLPAPLEKDREMEYSTNNVFLDM
jgi:hypothetical protein